MSGIFGLYVFWLAAVSTFVFLLERLFPWRSTQLMLRRGFFQDLFWLVFNGHFAGLMIGYGAGFLLGWMAFVRTTAGVPAPETVRLAANLPLWAQAGILLVAQDFLEWCIHRLLHRVPILWRIHRLHHSILELDWIGNFRFHWLEIVVYSTLKYFPLAILGIDFRVALAVAVFSTLVGHLNHSNLKLDWGPLRFVFNSPRFHIWHHRYLQPGDSGQNFAVVFSAWDWLFGTAVIPSEREAPEKLGFAGVERFPESLVRRFLLTFE